MADGGVGEAMLLGAAMGGGSSALMGRDPLKGALVGGLTGGVTGGISSALAPTGAAPIAGAAGSSGAAGLAAGAPASSLAATSIPGMVGPVDYSLASAAAPAGSSLGASMGPGTTLLGPSTGNLSGIQALPNAIPAASAGAPTTFTEGMSKFASNPMASLKANPFTAGAASLAAMNATRPAMYMPPEYNGPLKRLRLSENYQPAYAEGGIASLAGGGGAGPNTLVVGGPSSIPGMAAGGISSLGGYSDGGRMLKGPGDGMSDSIPANISGKRPARLADGEFVVPADVVSHLGNGSTDAGAKQLYHMMDKVRQARTGRKAQGREINPNKYVPV
jgi:hypothetical protein